MYKKYLKRIIDFSFAFLLLLITLPVLIISALAIKLESKGPALFKQRRIGKHNKEFIIYKFRTMKVVTEKEGIQLSDSERLNKVGKFLRKISLDEIPQCINILKGEMSFIGPRPLPVIYLPYYTEEEIRRHEVRPGISGLAQVNGRNTLQWEDRFKYDIEYVNNLSVKMDMKILIMTLQKVFKRENIQVRGTTNIKDFHTYRQNQREGGYN